MYNNLKTLASKLEETKEDFFLYWKDSVKESKLNYPDIEEDITEYGSRIFEATLVNLRTEARLHEQRIVEIGTEIGFKRAPEGKNLETVLDVFVLFRDRLWRHLRVLAKNVELTADEVFEIEKRVDLYIDHVLLSIAFAFISTKEQAVIDLIEKTIK
ncbi:TPA: hypothetical protein DDW69_04215 [candidate division CPR2 bacterium]|uniref:RsbT co-antagonist protein RsbRD N-terminal domain-containing protein n=1 Tax=candidate division CPR2 bacterium GW2011_GWC1_41_48 TaxID=1618344 RepID=A0A0G0YI95_UNCC2|nr:MAG: hypothetical protein UT47_C0002G0270 [candidate division CPR2 bacterium GW2011_GWC2_39_35]KKR28033.1 MAG: hypothetical protein UT60_C0029G0004 [candidate division CPR2 bacterium GW2011_GWD2_39_7]KKR28155.1 MAG: hypothetical protein UT59_C0034G0003 [candidate division CPR2 bacterium GW2011_GWD1_39_7]KKS09256.1 MAG: hypothetical protein UU65_C0002G0034 [candidate division CPR2 bacterium GW2011_GWC1_41_48]OGB60304.1 MAG: hypothetical protein A2Y27_00440 [candidate division CPR2 bacterium G